MTSNACPLCGKNNPISEWACESCGARLPNAGQSQPPALAAPVNSHFPVPPTSPLRQTVTGRMASLPFLPVLAALAFMIFGIGFAYSGGIGYLHSRQGADWPTVEGRITESKVVHSGGRFRRDGRYVDEFTPSVRYVYLVQDVAYKGSKLTSTESSGSRVTVERKLKEFQVGAKVPVYYNPADPEDSLLTPSDNTNDLVKLSAGLLFTAIGGIFAVSNLRKGP